jgi:hypothetical protein
MLISHPLAHTPVHAALEVVFGLEVSNADEAVQEVEMLLDTVLRYAELGAVEGREGGTDPGSARSLPGGDAYTLFVRTRSLTDALPLITQTLEDYDALRFVRVRAAVPALGDLELDDDLVIEDDGVGYLPGIAQVSDPEGGMLVEMVLEDDEDQDWVPLDEVLISRRLH